jgi:DNA polymerase-3 subunit delta'
MVWPIVGHDWAVALLRQSLATDRLAHAYLFAGPPQIGKTRLARTLAQALNCSEPDSPCGHCRSCQKTEQGKHPDVHLVVGEGVSGSIKIEQVRALQREAVLRPYEGNYRVFVLRQADRATPEAADSLLKTLEEPPAHVVLVLTATHAGALPSTVLSRCQRLDLRPATYEVIETALARRGVPPSQAQLLARLSAGRMGWALSVWQDETLLQQRQQDLDRLLELLSSDRVQRLDFAWKASRDPEGARRLLAVWTGWWRDLLLLCSQGPGYVLNVDRLDELQALINHSSTAQAWSTIRALQDACVQLDANVNARLALESLLLQLPHWPLLART